MENLQESTQAPKKPGPKPKPKGPTNEELLARIEILEALLTEVATHAGQAAIVRKHNLKPYEYVQVNKYAS